jgi:hypothetical protein
MAPIENELKPRAAALTFVHFEISGLPDGIPYPPPQAGDG